MNTFYGYAGKFLRVDLSAEHITEEALDEVTARKYLGGSGIGAKYLYDEVPPGVEWSDPANRVIIASGPLGGTRMGGSGTVSVATKGALTGGAGVSQANGFFGAFLRSCGYDGIILQGSAKRWVYLHIGSGKTELKDASHLLDKGTYETSELVKAELGQTERSMSVASIGPAGENLVRFACLFFDKGHTAAHNGIGAVIGSKKLKAIAVERGKGGFELKDKALMSALAEETHTNTLNDPMRLGTYRWGTMNGVFRSVNAHDGVAPVKNYTTCVWDIAPEKLEQFSARYIREHYQPKPRPCWACRMHHCHMLKIPEGPYAGTVIEEPEYEQLAAFGPLIGQPDAATAMMLSLEADNLGIDANETGWLLGLVMECFEKGILSRDKCDGLEMKWGNAEAARDLMRLLAHRKGIGGVLAEGTMRAAQKIGGEAPRMAIHTMNGDTPRGHDHRNRWPMLFDTCLASTSSDDGYLVWRPADLGMSIKPSIGANSSAEDTLAWNAQCKGAAQFEDSLGVCRFINRTDVKLLARAVGASTGWDYSAEEAMTQGRRVITLLRAFNIRQGRTPDREIPSPRYGSTPIDGPNAGKSIMAHWDELRRKYYAQMGWDAETGKPLPETLKQLGLDFAIPGLWKSGK